jgi:hypothetical protein
MLRCESVIPRRARWTRHLATYSFAGLVVGAAVVDATILADDPKQEQVNAELADPVLVPADMLAGAELDPALAGCEPKIRLLGPYDARPATRIDVDQQKYRIDTAKLDGIDLELRAPAGCTIHVGSQSAPAPLRAFFPAGTYEIWSSCDPQGTPVTGLIVSSR